MPIKSQLFLHSSVPALTLSVYGFCAGVWAFFFLISFGLMTHQWASSEEPPAGELALQK
jgi:hypothetical protein